MGQRWQHALRLVVAALEQRMPIDDYGCSRVILACEEFLGFASTGWASSSHRVVSAEVAWEARKPDTFIGTFGTIVTRTCPGARLILSLYMTQLLLYGFRY